MSNAPSPRAEVSWCLRWIASGTARIASRGNPYARVSLPGSLKPVRTCRHGPLLAALGVVRLSGPQTGSGTAFRIAHRSPPTVAPSAASIAAPTSLTRAGSPSAGDPATSPSEAALRSQARGKLALAGRPSVAPDARDEVYERPFTEHCESLAAMRVKPPRRLTDQSPAWNEAPVPAPARPEAAEPPTCQVQRSPCILSTPPCRPVT